MNLNRSQLSLLITFLSMSLLVLVLFNIHLKSKQKEDYVIEMSLADDDMEPLIEEQEEMPKEMANAEAIKSHIAYNETAKPSFGNPEPLKTLEELREEQANSAENDEPSDNSLSDSDFEEKIKELAKRRRENQQLIGEKEAKKEKLTNFAKRNTSISYSLVDRTYYSLPVPIYTCIEGGKIVVNIEVDNSGKVMEATFNEKSSSTTNGCLVDNAITYALKARFDSSGRSSQKGTITYLFQGK